MVTESSKLNEDIFHQIFTTTNLALFVLDSRGRILSANTELLQLYQQIYGEDLELNTKSFHTKIQQHISDNRHIFKDVLEGSLLRGNFSITVQSLEGLPLTLDISLWLLQPVNKEPNSSPLIAGSVQDVTERYILERRLRMEKEEAERSMESKSQFLANMSHEIRTPIQTIMGMIELLQDTILTREQSEYSRQVRFSADVLLSLVNDILDFSKIEANKLSLESIEFEVEKMLEDVVDLVSLEAHKKGLELTIDIGKDVPAILIGDPTRIRQILINLLKNAVKFTPSGSILTSLERQIKDDGPWLLFKVTDTGMGVAEELRDSLFTTFFQGDSSTTRKFGGTGLGLSISRHLVQMMSGQIGMEANPEGGSIFWFSLPVHIVHEEKVEQIRVSDPTERILIVDDCKNSRNALAKRLRQIGYTQIKSAESGELALSILTQSAETAPYDLCFIDMIMPEMDGWRLAALIKQNPQLSKTRLILMVPQGMLGADAKMTLLQWFNAYVNKPIKRIELAPAILSARASTVGEDEITELEPVEEDVSSNAQESPCRRASILIVEDHPVNQQLFSLIIEKEGHRSVLCDDGLEALDAAEKEPFDIIFMDIQMPKMNGYEASRVLRQRGYTGPIIAITASALEDERDRCLAAGMDDILVKPFRRPQIVAALNSWLKCNDESPAHPQQEEKQVDNNTEVLDKRQLLELFMGNMETVQNLLRRYIDRTQAQLIAMKKAIQENQPEQLRIDAHTIKGSALNLAAAELAKIATETEKAAIAGDMESAAALMPQIDAAFARFVNKAQTIINEGA
jgi:signal transduction histidine kinase/DNA-binding response OmpR family regulator